MAYRGEDLDLRVVQGRSGRGGYVGDDGPGLNGRWSRTGGGRAEPLYVDETVLACSNHAYDVAQAHGASEVRLEHLVHAMTRVEAAAEVLEQRGIREAHLRRESASVIASDIPVGRGHTSSPPRASPEFSDVLRRASDSAAQRGTTASVHDLLWVLLNYNREIPAIALLLRHASDWQSWDWPHMRAAAGPQVERRVVYTEGPRSRYETQTVYVEGPPPSPSPRAQTVYVEAAPQPLPPPRPQLQDGVYVRLDQLENTMRTLHTEITGDRRTMSELIRELQRDLAAPRPEGAQIPQDVIRQLENVELAMEANLETLGKTTQQLTERLQSLEKSVSGGMAEGARNWAAMSERFKAFDNVLSTGGGKTDLSAVTQQLTALNERLSTFERGMSGMVERFVALDRAVTGQVQSAPVLQTLINDRFQSLKSVLEQSENDGGAVVQQIVDRVDQRHEESAQVLKALADRVVQIDNAGQDATRQHEHDLKELHEALLKLGSNQQTLSENLDQWRLEQSGDIGIISNRIGALEKTNSKPIELMEKISGDVQLLQRAALAEIERDSGGFKHWLFGTNDIMGATWRNETNAVRQTLRQLRTGKDQRA